MKLIYQPKISIKKNYSRTRLQCNERDNILGRYKWVLFLTEEYNVMFNSDEFFGNAEHVTLYTRCHLNRCRYKRVRL